MFKAVKKTVGLLQAGKHLATITSASEVVPSHADSMPWKDVTPQIKVTVRGEKGSISQWFNLKGYQNKSDFPDGNAPEGCFFASSEFGNEQYVVDETTKERRESEEKTETAMRMFGEFGATAGINAGADFTLEDLIGKEIGVVVRDADNGGVNVHYFMEAERVKSTEEVEA